MYNTLYVEVMLLDGDKDLLPSYAHDEDAGMDLRSSIDTTLQAETWAVVPTGIAINIPVGYVGLVHPRSGMAAKHGITVLNAPGTIDAGYTGEVKVILLNGTTKDYKIERGDRIAQLVIQEIMHAKLGVVSDFTQTQASRLSDGFGSSGV